MFDMVRILQTYLNHISAGERLERLLEDASRDGRVPRARPLPVPTKQKTAAQVEEMVGLWHQCRNVEEVARLVGADQTTVRRNLRKVGIDTSPRRMTDEDIQEIGRLADEGLSCRQIGAQVGWTHGSVASAIRRYRGSAQIQAEGGQ